MKIPKKIVYNGIRWTVNLKMPKDEAWGETIFNDNEINIRPDLSDQNREASLVHEMLHVITWSSGIDRFIDSDLEEKIVHAMASGIYDLYKKGFFK